MKALLLHCKEYGVTVGKLATRPSTITPEPLTKEKAEQKLTDCVVALITVESSDDTKNVSAQCATEIAAMAREVKKDTIVVLPFAHLSSNLADSKKGLATLKAIESNLSEIYNVVRGHFGSHKELLLDIAGHPGNVRFREF